MKLDEFKKLDDVELICPNHHPFIYYLAGIVHLKPSTVQSLIAHGWIHKPSGNLSIFFYGASAPIRVVRGHHKAWCGFSNHSNSCVSYYTSELGHVYAEYTDDCEYETMDAWDVLGNLGSTIWRAKF